MQRICKISDKPFDIRPGDLAFYERMEVPPPNLSPQMRRRRRLSFRNEHTLYRRSCDLTGKSIISNVSPNAPYKVYSHDAWWSDRWDAQQFGRDYDLSRPFFPQFQALLKEVPLIQLVVSQSENCDYTNYSWCNKNCYLSFDLGNCEEVYYSSCVYDSRSCYDCFHLKEHCELCYECSDCRRCYNCRWCLQCQNSNNLSFCFDCQGSHDCFMCSNLRNAEYCFNNQPLGRKEYEHQMAKINTGSFETTTALWQQFITHKRLDALHHHSYNTLCERCDGYLLRNCKNTHYAFDCAGVEDGAYLYDGAEPVGKSIFDDDRSGWNAELCYETMGCPKCYHSRALISCGYAKESDYCYFCMNPNHCFGSVGLRDKNFCILNKEYPKEKYFELRSLIIEQMIVNGEWGEFFPMTISPFSYNETLAQDFFPQTKEETLRQGLLWKDEESRALLAHLKPLPDLISDVDDLIIEHPQSCTKTSKSFRVLKQELNFYRKMNIPFPRLSPEMRHESRVRLRPSYQLEPRTCAKSGFNLLSPFNTSEAKQVLSAEEYQESVYRS